MYSASTARPRAVSNTPATSAAQGHGRLAATTASAAPVTARASAVLKVIGFWLPKRNTAVARASQATIAVTPIAAHSRPPASVIAAAARAARDGRSAGRSGAPGSGAGEISSGANGVSSAPRTSTSYSPPTPVTATAVRPRRNTCHRQGESPIPADVETSLKMLTPLAGPPGHHEYMETMHHPNPGPEVPKVPKLIAQLTPLCQSRTK